MVIRSGLMGTCKHTSAEWHDTFSHFGCVGLVKMMAGQGGGVVGAVLVRNMYVLSLVV